MGIGVLLFSFLSIAQNKQLLYNVSDLPQSLLLNPGTEITFDKHIGIPFFSGFSVGAGSSGVSVLDIFEEGGDINARIEEAIFSLSNRDFFTVNQQWELLSFGWKGKQKERYYSAGLYQELDVITYFPRDLAVLGYSGNADFIGTSFDFNDFSVAAEVLTVYHFGVNQKINKKLRLGVRGKIYSSIFNINSTNNEGVFITTDTPEGPNFLSHDVIGANVVTNTSGFSSVSGASLVSRAIINGNFGLGFDIGGTYTLNEKISLTASLIDIGVIFHNSNLQNYRLRGDFSLQGIDFSFPAVNDPDATIDYFEILEDEFNEQLPFEDELAERYTTFRPVKFNAGANYGFGGLQTRDCNCFNDGPIASTNNVGLQFFAMKRPQAVQAALTGYFDKRWGEALRTKVTYTIDPFSASNVGLLVSAKINKFNVYLAGENILDYPNIARARNASVQFGFQLVFNEY